MTLESFEARHFQAKTAAMIDHANSIIAEYQARGFTLTLRQLYYQFVARSLIDNKQSEYKRLGERHQERPTVWADRLGGDRGPHPQHARAPFMEQTGGDRGRGCGAISRRPVAGPGFPAPKSGSKKTRCLA